MKSRELLTAVGVVEDGHVLPAEPSDQVGVSDAQDVERWMHIEGLRGLSARFEVKVHDVQIVAHGLDVDLEFVVVRSDDGDHVSLGLSTDCNRTRSSVKYLCLNDNDNDENSLFYLA